jgi:KaiC/GvpD/RAD55 family RecA-like ATPase
MNEALQLGAGEFVRSMVIANKGLIGLILLVAVALTTSNPSVYAAAQPTTPITLYAHAQIPNSTIQGPTLNAQRQWGSQQAALLRQEIAFTLNPPLGGDVSFDGTSTMTLWVRADNRLTGFLQIHLSEFTADGQNRTIPGFGFDNVPVSLDSRAHAENFALLVNFTLTKGSALQLRVRLITDDRITGAYLLYDNPTTPTQITLPVKGAATAAITLTTPEGTPTHIFLTKGATNATVVAQINVTDYLGLYMLDSATLSITNEQGNNVATLPNILTTEHRANQYTATLKSNLNLTSGTYTITILITDKTGNIYTATDQFYISPYYITRFRIIDQASDPVAGANITAVASAGSYGGQTNQTGWATLQLPSSNFVGQYSAFITWRNSTFGPYVISVEGDKTVTIGVPIVDVTINVRLLGINLSGADLRLTKESKFVSSGTTDASGDAYFQQVSRGNYTAQVQYLGTFFQTQVPLDASGTVRIDVPLPFQGQLPFVLILIVGVVAVSILMHRRKLYEAAFGFINVITKGGVPNSCTGVIAGGSGSGKTVLLISLADRSAKTGRGCIYVTNVELPANVRNTSAVLGIDLAKHEAKGNFVFIDCYSALSGIQSKERRALASFTDLTSLGILISSAMEEFGRTTDVYFDSLTPLFTTLKPDYVVSFLQSIGAKVKSSDGRLMATIGTSVEKEALTRIEELSDVVVETQLLESRSGQKRRLRIRKLRGHSYIDTWVSFKIGDGRGVTFLTRKPYVENESKTSDGGARK